MLVSNLLGQAGNVDSAEIRKPAIVYSFNNDNPEYGNLSIHDSVRYSLDSFSQVHPFRITTGNLGAPGHSLQNSISPFEPFTVRKDPFAYFGFNRFERKFYYSNKPYTLLNYYVGQRREQYVNVFHTRNFGENLNFSFHFLRIRSEGFYLRQNTSNTSVRSNLWYKSPGKKYAFLADVYWTGANVAENGGLEKDSVFEFGASTNRQVHSVNLDQAGNIQRKRGIWTKHMFGFGSVTDSIQLDSITKRAIITPSWGISVISEIGDELYQYKDLNPGAGFYNVIYRDSTETNDSTYLWRVNNAVHLELFNQYGLRKWSGYAGVRHEAGEYFQDTIYSHFHNVYTEVGAAFCFNRNVDPFCSKSGRVYRNRLWFKAQYVAAGTNQGNYNLNANGVFQIAGRNTLAMVNLVARNTDPSFQAESYSGNHQRWINSFSEVMENSGEFKLLHYPENKLLNEISISYRLSSIGGYIYFDEFLLPQQISGSILTQNVSFDFSMTVAWFNLNSKFIYTGTSDRARIRLPEIQTFNTLFANLNLFKRKLQMQIGADITWFSGFTGEGYLPSIAQFHLQSTRAVGNYIYIDPWVSIRIKPVRVFVKAEHVNAGLMGRNYFLLAHYPHNDFALKFGVSWLFND